MATKPMVVQYRQRNISLNSNYRYLDPTNVCNFIDPLYIIYNVCLTGNIDQLKHCHTMWYMCTGG